MEKYFDLKLRPVNGAHNLNTIYEENTKFKAKEFIQENNNQSYIDLLKKDGINQLDTHEFIVTCYNPEFKQHLWEKEQYKYFKEEFGKQNILSIKTHTHDGYLHSHILVCSFYNDNFLLSDWITNNTVNQNKVDSYYRYMYTTFLKIEKDGLNKNISEESEQMYGFKQDETGKEIIFDVLSVSNNIQTELSLSEFEKVFKETLYYYTKVEFRLYRDAQYGKIPPQKFMLDVEKYLREKQHLPEHDIPLMLKKIYNAVYEYYILEDLLNNDDISDIKVMAPDKIRIKYQGKRMTTNSSFIDMDDYIRFLEGVVIRNHTNMSPMNALQNFTDKYSNDKFILRFNLSTNYVNSCGYPYLQIRKIGKDKYTINDLIDYDMLTPELADYLIEKTRNGRGFVFCGKGGSGKTSLMNTLLEYIPYNKSGLFIQENEELFSNTHPELMFQHIVTPREENSVGYSLKDLTRNALLCDQDVIGVGEVKGDEALYLINACMTGAQGWCSVHSYDSASAIDKLADYIKYASDYPKSECMYMLKELEVLIFMKNFKIYEIKEISGWDEKNRTLIFKEVYKRTDSI